MITALVTGGSSGIGLGAAQTLIEKGCRVYTLSRRTADIPGAKHLMCDVTDEASVRMVVAQIISECGKLDIVINCAGYGISGTVEFTDPADSHRQLEVNLFGIDNVCRAVIPHMRTQGGGRIVNISSVAGVLPIPYQTWYSVSKAAINSYSLALNDEVRHFGISVCSVLPGDTATGFTAARNKSLQGDDIYGGRITRSVAGMEKDERGGMPSDVAGAIVAKVALRKNAKPQCTLGPLYKVFVVLGRVLPVRFVTWGIYQMYGK